jgi:hypothetical protein
VADGDGDGRLRRPPTSEVGQVYEGDDEVLPEAVDAMTGWISRLDPETSKWRRAFVEIRHEAIGFLGERASQHRRPDS